MDFINSFGQFDPNDPAGFNYRQRMMELQRQQQLAQQFSGIQAVSGGSKASSLAAILAQGLGGYMQGRSTRGAGDAEEAAKQQAKYYTDMLNSRQSPDEIMQGAKTFYPDQEAQYTYKNPGEVGPAYEPAARYSPAADSQAASQAMAPAGRPAFAQKPYANPAARVGTEVGRATTKMGPDGLVEDPKNPGYYIGEGPLDRAGRRLKGGLETIQRATGALPPLPEQAPVAAPPMSAPVRQASAPLPASVPAQAQQMAPQPVQPAQRSMQDTFNVDTSGQQEALASRSNYIRDALKRQQMQQAEAEQTLEQSQNPYAVPFLKRAAAQRQSEAEIADFTRKEQIKAIIGRDPNGKAIGTPQANPDGSMYQTVQRPDGSVVAVPVQGAVDPKMAAEARAKEVTRGASDATVKRVTSDIDTVLGGSDPEKATGLFAKLTAGITNATGYVTDAAQARARFDGLASQAIQTMISSMQQAGMSPSQLANTETEAKRLAASVLNLDYNRMDALEIRRQVGIFRDHLTTLARNSLTGAAGAAPTSSGGTINGIPAYSRGTTLRPGQ